MADPEVLVREGVQLRREGHDQEALERFRRAWEASPTPRTRAQMGFAEQALARWQLAEAHVLEARESSADPWVRSHLDVIERSLAALGRHLASLTVSGGAPGAELVLDGTVAGRLPLARPLRVAAGTVTVEARAPGYEPFSTRVVVAPPDAPAVVEVTMRPLPPPAPAPAVVVTSPAPRAITPLARVEAPRVASTWRVFAVTGWALGGAGIAAGIASLALREGHVSTFNSAGCTLYAESPLRTSGGGCASQYDLAEGSRAGAIVAFAAGAAFAVGGTVAWLLRPRAAGALAWGCAPSWGGLSCAVRF